MTVSPGTQFGPYEVIGSLGDLAALLIESAIAPARLNPEIPEALDALVMRMLEKKAEHAVVTFPRGTH